MHPTKLFTMVAVAAISLSVVAADVTERKFVRQGMGEGEVLYKIGNPDHEAFIWNVRGEPEEKTWTYFPHPQDPQTMTVITFRAGIVSRIDRKISR